MSIQAMTWAYAQKMKSSVKFVLVTLCDYADAEYRLWPSIADLVEKTCMDRKTVMSAIAELEENGYLVDTGERTGKTRQVKVYFVNVNGTGNGTVKEYQKRNSTENGTVPFFPSKGTVFPTKEYQISHERVPNLVHGTIKEPLKNHQGTVSTRAGEAVDNPVGDIPDPAVAMAIALRKAGVRVNAAHPMVISLVEQGVSLETVMAAVEEAREKTSVVSIGYVTKIIERWAADAKRMDVRGADKRDSPDNWWASDAGIDRKGRELGLMPRPTESYADYRVRIHDEIRKRREAAA